jgi:hypothetical protein
MARSRSKGGASTSGDGVLWAVLTIVLVVLVLGLIFALLRYFDTSYGHHHTYIHTYVRPHARSPAAAEHFFDSKCEYKLIFFYMDTCPHCVSFKPEWNKMSKHLQNNVPNVCAKELSDEDHETSDYELDGYPTVVLENIKTGGRQVYEGPRTLQGLQSFVEKNTS